MAPTSVSAVSHTDAARSAESDHRPQPPGSGSDEAHAQQSDDGEEHAEGRRTHGRRHPGKEHSAADQTAEERDHTHTAHLSVILPETAIT